MNFNKQAKSNPRDVGVIATCVVAVLIVLAFLFGGSKASVYKDYNVDKVNIKANNILMYVDSTTDVEKLGSYELELENTDVQNKRLKIVYEVDGKNETQTTEVLAEDENSVQLEGLFMKSDITDLGIYSKVVSIYEGETLLQAIEYTLNVGTFDVDKTGDVRVLNTIVHENDLDSTLIWFDTDDLKTLDKISFKETNTSKVVVTGSSFVKESINSNEFTKVNVNSEIRSSVLENELYTDGFVLEATISYTDGTNVSKTITQDFVRTNALEDFVSFQNDNLEQLKNVN